MSLWGDFLKNDDLVIDKWEQYFPIYERYLSPWVNRSLVLVEIGVGDGGSLRMWRRYLGPLAQIVGLDIRPECKALEEPGINIRIGNQSDTVCLRQIIDEFGPPDIIIDDGSHIMSDVITTFTCLYQNMSKNGIYIIEDMHTAYWSKFGGGYDVSDTFMNLSKQNVDALNARHSGVPVTNKPYMAATMGIHFYDSMVVYERGVFATRRSQRKGRKLACDSTEDRGSERQHASE